MMRATPAGAGVVFGVKLAAENEGRVDERERYADAVLEMGVAMGHRRAVLAMLCAVSALLVSGCANAGAVGPPVSEAEQPSTEPVTETEEPSAPSISWTGMSSDDLCAAAAGSAAVQTLTGTTATTLTPKNASGAACAGLGENNSGFDAVVTQMSNPAMTAEQMKGSLQGCDSQELFDTELQGHPAAVVYCTKTDAAGVTIISGYSQIWTDSFNAYITLDARGTTAPDAAGYFALIPQMWTEILS